MSTKLTKDTFYDWMDENNRWDKVETTEGRLDDKPFTIFHGWEAIEYLMTEMVRELVPGGIEMYEKSGAFQKGRWRREPLIKYGDLRIGSNGTSPGVYGDELGDREPSEAPYLIPTEVQEEFEKAGFEGAELEDVIGDWGFDDEYQLCFECGETIMRTSPDSYGWRPEYYQNEVVMCCMNCFEDNYKDGYIESMVNDPSKALEFTLISEDDLYEEGFEQYNDSRYENGWHRGQTDDPKKIYKQLRHQYDEVVFTIDSVGQFDVSFSAWVRGGSEDEEV